MRLSAGLVTAALFCCCCLAVSPSEAKTRRPHFFRPLFLQKGTSHSRSSGTSSRASDAGTGRGLAKYLLKFKSIFQQPQSNVIIITQTTAPTGTTGTTGTTGPTGTTGTTGPTTTTTTATMPTTAVPPTSTTTTGAVTPPAPGGRIIARVRESEAAAPIAEGAQSAQEAAEVPLIYGSNGIDSNISLNGEREGGDRRGSGGEGARGRKGATANRRRTKSNKRRRNNSRKSGNQHQKNGNNNSKARIRKIIKNANRNANMNNNSSGNNNNNSNISGNNDSASWNNNNNNSNNSGNSGIQNIVNAFRRQGAVVYNR